MDSKSDQPTEFDQERFLKLRTLAKTFPSMEIRQVECPEDIHKIAQDSYNGSGVRNVARFLLYLWTGGGYPWNLVKSWGS